VTLHVATLGEGPGTPVVCAHGLVVGSLAQWYFTLAPALSGRTVWMYDQRGHGKSPAVADGFDLATLGGDLLSILDRAGRADLVGHSYGGLVALWVAMHHPHRVRRLVLVDVPLPPAPDLLGVAGATDPADLAAMLPEALQAQLASGGRRARRFLRVLGALVASTLFADLQAESPLDPDAIRAVSHPTLLLYGRTSACLDDGHTLAGLLPDASLSVLPAGHFLPVEVPHLVVPAIVEHLDG
jgi:pimeloyl-ACP methyl ester carboxylesterase